MSRSAPLSLIALFLLVLSPPAAADGGAALELTYGERVRAELVLSGGDVVTVGERGSATACRAARALVERRAADGTVRWSLSDGSGSSLLAGPGAPDAATVVASSARDVTHDAASDTLIVVGELVQVTGAGAGRAGFAARLTTDGAVLGVMPLGPPFRPGPPPPEAPTCIEICNRLQNAAGEWWRPRAAAAGAGGDFYVAGSRRLGTGAEEAFLAALTPLGLPLWSTTLGTGEPGEGRAIAVGDEAGEVIYVTGSVGAADADVVVEKYDAVGGVLASIIAAGPLADGGESIVLAPQGPRVQGRFNGRLELGGERIDAGPCEQRFSARFDRTLQLLELEADPVAPVNLGLRSEGGGPKGAAVTGRGLPQAVTEPQPPALLGIHVLKGFWQGGGICQLEESDDSYLTLAGDPLSETESQAAFIAAYAIDPAAAPLTEVSLELSSDFCTSLRVSLGVGGSDIFYTVGAGSMCPLGEPTATAAVPVAVLDALGFAAGGIAAEQGLPLLVKVELTFYGAAECGPGLCTSGAKDGSVDELELGSGR